MVRIARRAGRPPTRKPDVLPFELAVELLSVPAADTVYIGDRPEKDVGGATAAGLGAIRVRTGEWSHRPDDPRAWASLPTVADAIDLVERRLDAQAATTPTSTRKSSKPGTRR